MNKPIISAFVPVYNESSRIKYAIQSLKWCDEIFVLDKSSEDNTVELAKKYGATSVKVIPNTSSYDVNEFLYLQELKGEWVVIFTASDIIDRSLAEQIVKIVNTAPEDVGSIDVPLKRYIHGVEGKKSPWYSDKRTRFLFRKDNIRTNSNDPHTAISLINKKSISIPSSYGYLYHLTHVDMDIMMERHIRYWRAEGENYQNDSLRPAFQSILGAIKITIKRNTFLGGWDYVALAIAYIGYYMMSFLYKWEHKRGTATILYSNLRENNYLEWNS